MLTDEKYREYLEETINHSLEHLEVLSRNENKNIHAIIECEKFLFEVMKEKHKLDMSH